MLPALLVSVFLSAPAVLHWPGGELNYGAHSLGRDVLHHRASVALPAEPANGESGALRPPGARQPFLLPLLLVLAAWQWAARRPVAAVALLGILAATIGAHWLLFRLFRVPLPMDRTAIWIVPLCTLAIGSAATGRRSLTVMLYVMSFYFVLCLRLNYFKEWSWDADVNKVYPVLAWYNHTYGVRDVASNWMYGSSLNFYRVQSGRESFGEIESPMKIPARSFALRPLLSLRRRLHQVPAPASGLPRPRHRRGCCHPPGGGVSGVKLTKSPSALFSLRFSLLLCIAIPEYLVIFHKFHATLDSCATVACCAADIAAIATRPYSVRTYRCVWGTFLISP